MDVSGGRYNQINNNLKADAVQAAEVIEGHQPIKSLRGKTFTDDVALNLKLKPEVRSKWIYTVMAGEVMERKHFTTLRSMHCN